ncbi:hypothetical protein PF001_g31010, partial [Phytophthora fragariae]
DVQPKRRRTTRGSATNVQPPIAYDREEFNVLGDFYVAINGFQSHRVGYWPISTATCRLVVIQTE